MLEGHGDDLHRHKGKINYNFSSNVYYKGCPEAITTTLYQQLNQIQNYPSPSAQELNELAAQHFNLDQNQFLFTNGATEAFYLIAQLFRDQSASIFGPTFSEYEDACKIHSVHYEVRSYSLLVDSHVDSQLAFICNPNNPDGKLLNQKEIESLLVSNPKTLFVIDEAYTEFSLYAESAIALIRSYDNLVVVRSLTKTFAIPGLRLGYLVSNSQFMDRLMAIKMPWSVNSLAIAAGQHIFNHYDELTFDRASLMKETMTFKRELAEIEWLNVLEGAASFFLVRLNGRSASLLKSYLIEQHGILIREANNFTGLAGEHIRLSVQSNQSNQSLISALKSWK